MAIPILTTILGGLQIFGLLEKTVVDLQNSKTPEAKAQAFNNLADGTLNALATVSTGGQANTIAEVKNVVPQFHEFTKAAVALAESTGASGEEKAKMVDSLLSNGLSAYSGLAKGGAQITAEEIQAVQPQIREIVNNTVTLLFPTNPGSILNAQPHD